MFTIDNLNSLVRVLGCTETCSHPLLSCLSFNLLLFFLRSELLCLSLLKRLLGLGEGGIIYMHTVCEWSAKRLQ
jgi:hypothetical protein